VAAALAEIARRRAEWRLQQHQRADADVDVRDGLAFAGRALVANPRLAVAAGIEGALHLVAAHAAPGAAERKAAAERARVSLEKALSIDANLEREYRPLLTEAARLAAGGD
jgi:hypothetical protein